MLGQYTNYEFWVISWRIYSWRQGYSYDPFYSGA